MRALWRKWADKLDRTKQMEAKDEEQLQRQVDALFDMLGKVLGPDKLVFKAGKLDALQLMRSRKLRERVLALQRIVLEDPTIAQPPPVAELPRVLDEVQETMAELIARRTLEETLEKKIALKMQERHDEYVRELKMQLLKEEGGPDNAQTLRKYAELEKMDRRHLARSVVEALRPRSVDEVVGQERAIKALFSKIASPFPQHVLLYGPPGVGKTTVARLALEYAKTLPYTPFDAEAAFVETNGATLRWDPREVSNPLLGSVHDPIYQGARRDLAESAVPEPKPGLVTEAHGGVLFIDEIGEIDPMLQSKLLKVLEDKRVRFESAYYDANDPHVPKYIKKLFDEGAPADFILIGATTRDPGEINPALRSRCAEVFFDPLSRTQVRQIVMNAAERLQVRLAPEAAELISSYTVEGRKASNLLADAYGVALQRESSTQLTVGLADVQEVARVSRLTPYVLVHASKQPEVGRIFGLAVSGYLGSVIEIEAVAFPAREIGKGQLRFNQTAGDMAKDSVFNATSVARRLTGQNLSDWDIHVNVVGGGRIDGPSAGAAIALAVTSAILEWPVRQDVAVTGEISIQGRIKPVGGVYEKLYGARQSGITCVVVPQDNAAEVPPAVDGLNVITVTTLEEMLPLVFAGEPLRPHAPEHEHAAGQHNAASAHASRNVPAPLFPPPIRRVPPA